MRAFVLKVLVALLIVAGFHLAAGFMADGRTDDYYLRFATPRMKSLVLGGSRAAQGVHPDVFNAQGEGPAFEGPLFNFGFTIAHSPYGPTYYRAIERKLDPTARNGLFLLCVDPWVLTANKDRAERPERFREAERTLGQQWTFAMRPNYEYLAHHYDRGWGSLVLDEIDDTPVSREVLPDGRLQLHIPMDSATVAIRTARKLEHYRTVMMKDRVWSEARYDWLARTVELLQPHGRVVLVRLPVSPGIRALEDQLASGLDDRLAALAGRYGIPYVDLSHLNKAVGYTDGNHLDEAGGRRVSVELAARLRGL